MKKNITIIDYGSGNILSAKQSFAKVIKTHNLDAEVCISENIKTIKRKSLLIGLNFSYEIDPIIF